MKTAALLACALALGFARGYLAARGVPRGEFAALAVFAALGICALVSAAHLLSLYLGLELMSLSLYAMIALRRDHPPAIEAALKYFVLGALASGLFLYGASMIYGATGELGFARIAAAAAAGDRALLSLGLAFALCGAAFKLGAAPFHMWLPDVYDGAPAATTAFIAAAPKIAAFAFLLRVIVEALGDLISDWRPMLIFLAVASLAVGNLAAIAQTNIKRMLAYSFDLARGLHRVGRCRRGRRRRGGVVVLCHRLRADERGRIRRRRIAVAKRARSRQPFRISPVCRRARACRRR